MTQFRCYELMIIAEELLFLNRFSVRRFHLHVLKEGLEYTYSYHLCFKVNLLVLLYVCLLTACRPN